jgi:hypothetical protein
MIVDPPRLASRSSRLLRSRAPRPLRTPARLRCAPSYERSAPWNGPVYLFEKPAETHRNPAKLIASISGNGRRFSWQKSSPSAGDSRRLTLAKVVAFWLARLVASNLPARAVPSMRASQLARSKTALTFSFKPLIFLRFPGKESPSQGNTLKRAHPQENRISRTPPHPQPVLCFACYLFMAL